MISNSPFFLRLVRAFFRRLTQFRVAFAAASACAVLLSAPAEDAQAQAACPANSFRANSGNCECYPNWGGGAHNTTGVPNACQCRTFESYYQLPGASAPECVPNGFLDRFKSLVEQCDTKGWDVRRDDNQIYHCQVRNLNNQNAFATSGECALNAPPDAYYPCHAVFGNPPVFPFTETFRGKTFNYCPAGTLPVSHNSRSTCIPSEAANYFRICAERGWTTHGPTAAGQSTYECGILFRDGATNRDYNRCRIAGPPDGVWCRDVFGEPYFPQKPDGSSPRYYYNCPNGELEDRSGCANLCGNGIRLAPDESGLNRCAPCLSGVAQDGECAPCPAGTAANSNRSECIVCPAGLTPSADGEQCVACPAGTFSTSDNLECRACPRGTIPNDGRTGCLNPSAIECPAGQEPNNANNACVNIVCPSGQQLNSARTECECPAGTVADGDGSGCVNETVAAYRALCEAGGWTAQNRGRALGELYSGERYEVCRIRSRDGAANFTREYCVMHAANARGGAIDEYFEPQWGTNAHTRQDIRCEEVFPNWKSEGFPSRPGGFDAFLYNCPDGKRPSAQNGAAADCTCTGVTTGQCGDEIRECQRRAAAAGVSNASALVPGLRNQLLCQKYANNTHLPGFENDFTPRGSCVVGETCQDAFDENPFPCLTGYASDDNAACESCPANWRRKFDNDNNRWTCERTSVDRELSGPLVWDPVQKGQSETICTIAGWTAEDLDTTVGRIWACRIPLWEMDQAKFLQGELAGTQYAGCVVYDSPVFQSCSGRTRTRDGKTFLCDCDDAGEAVGDWRTNGLPLDLDGPGGAQLPLLLTFNCPGALEPADYSGREHQKVCACPREGWSGERGECRSERDDCRALGGRVVPAAHLQEYCEGYHADGSGRCVIGWGDDAPNSCKTLLPPVCEAGYVLNRGETECVLQQHIAECDARGGRVEGDECVGFQLDGEGRCFVERGGKNPANCVIAFEDTPQKECPDDQRIDPNTLKCEQCPAGFTNSEDDRSCVLREPTGDDYTGTENESSSCVLVWYPGEQVTRYECESALPEDEEGEARSVCELAGWTFQTVGDPNTQSTQHHWRCFSEKMWNAKTGANIRYCVLGPDSYTGPSGNLQYNNQTACADFYPNWKTQGLPRRADTGPDRVFGTDDDELAHTTFNCPANREVADPLGRYLPGYCVCPSNPADGSTCATQRAECLSRQGLITFDETNHLEELCVNYLPNGGGECIIGATDSEYRYASDANRHEDARNAETCEDAFAREPPPCPPDQYAATNSARECASTDAQGVCTTYETVAVHSCETCPDGQIPNHDRDGCVDDDIDAHIAECEYRTGVPRENFPSDFRGERLGGALAAEDLLCENYAGEAGGTCRLGPSDSPDSCHAAFRSQGARRPCPVGSASFGWNACRQCLEGYVNNPDGDRCVLEGALAAQMTQCEDRGARMFTRQRTAANGREVTDHYCADFLPAGGGECRMGDTDFERDGTCAKFFREYAPPCRVGFHWNSDNAKCEACPAGEVANESGHSCEAENPRALCEAGGWVYENIAAEPDDPAKEVCRVPVRNHSTGEEWSECVARLAKDAELTTSELRCETAFPQWTSSGFPPQQTGTTVTFVFSCPSDAPLHSSREYCRGHSGHCAAQDGTESGGNCSGTFPDSPCALGAECVAPLDFREACLKNGGTVTTSECTGLPDGDCEYGDDCDAEFARLLADDDEETCAENYVMENARCVPATAAEVERLRELCRVAGWRRVNYGDGNDRYDVCSLPLRDAISGGAPGEYVVRGERLSYCVMNRDIALREGDIPCETVFPDWRTAGFPQSEGDDDERVFIYNCPGGLSSDATRQYCPGSDADCEARGWTAENGECSGAFPASPCETGAGLACLTNFAAGEKCESVGGAPTPTHCLGVGGVQCAFGSDCDAAYENHELGCPRNRRLAEERCVLATDREVSLCRAQRGTLGAEWDAEADDWVALCVFPPAPFGGARATCRLSDCGDAYAAYAAAPTCPAGQALQTGSYACGCPPGMQEFDLGNGAECLVPHDCSGTGLENDIPNAQNNGCECPSELPYMGFYSDRCVSACAAEHIAIDGVCSPQCQEDEFRNANGTCECRRF